MGQRVMGQRVMDTVTIGLSPTDLSSGPLYAHACGAFARHGIGADLRSLPLNYAQNMVLDGTLDVAFSDVTSVVQLIEEKGAEFAILAGAAVFDADEPVNVLIAPKGVTVRSGADLNGKIGGVPRLRSFGELATRNWIDRNGGDSSTVSFVELPFTEFADALEDGRMDVGPISEPLKTMFAPRTSFVGVSYAAIAPAFVFAVFVARRSWAQDNPDLAARFTAAMDEGNAWANTHRAETAEILRQRYDVPPELVSTMARARFPERLTPDLVQPVLDLAVRYGFGHATDAAGAAAMTAGRVFGRVLDTVGRAVVGLLFVDSGLRVLRTPGPAAALSAPTLAALRARIPALPADDVAVVRLNAAVHVAAGSLLVTGRATRWAALALAGSLVPTSVAGHAYWAVADPARRRIQKSQFEKNMGILGGLLIAAARLPRCSG